MKMSIDKDTILDNVADDSSFLPVSLGKQIRFYRKRGNMSLATLAKSIHKSKGTLSKYESGSIVIDIVTLQEIAEALQVDMTSFFPKARKMPPQDKAANSLFDTSKNIYMYHIADREFHTSIMQITPDQVKQTANIILYYIAKEPPDVTSYSCLYYGSMIASYVNISFLLNNHYNPLENAMITLSMSLRKQDFYSGFLTGIHFNYLRPSVLKVVLTQKKLAHPEQELKEHLLFSKEEIQLLKAKNHLSLSDD